MRRGFSIGIFCAATLCPVSAGGEDDGLPPTVGMETFRSIFEASPFRRYLSLKETLALSGVAELPTGPVVTVIDRGRSQTFVVGERPNVRGWRLLELQGSDDLLKVVARIDVGGQEIELRFTPAQVEPPAGNSRSRERPGPRSEEMVMVEALLRQLDGEVADQFVALESEAQETFRSEFATYVRTYPEAGGTEQLGYARDKLDEISEAAAGGGEETESSNETTNE